MIARLVAQVERLGARVNTLGAFDRLRAHLGTLAGPNIDQLRLTFLRHADPTRSCPLRRVREHGERVDDYGTHQGEVGVVLIPHVALTSSGRRDNSAASSTTSSVRPARASARSRPPTSNTLWPASPSRTRIQSRRGRTNSDRHKPATANPRATREIGTPGVFPICSLTQRTQPSNWIEPLPSGRLTPSPTLRAIRTG